MRREVKVITENEVGMKMLAGFQVKQETHLKVFNFSVAVNKYTV